jgi:dTDP-glucose 4,6-dehydratase
MGGAQLERWIAPAFFTYRPTASMVRWHRPIPLFRNLRHIIHALEGKALPIYRDGSNVRDWLHVSDHCDALMVVIERGRIGETYSVGGGNERNNCGVVGLTCDALHHAFADDPDVGSRFPSCPAAAGGCLPLAYRLRDRPAGP